MQKADCRVLLVEDDTNQVCLIKTLLARIPTVQFTLEVANRLSNALDTMANTVVDVILLDLSLPDSQGLDTVIKMRKRFAAIPIVVLTGVDDENLALDTINH